MVTILESPNLVLGEVIPAEPAPALEARPARTVQWYEWGYSVPCAGVRYYSFRPAEKPRPVPVFLPVKLIDERVILL